MGTRQFGISFRLNIHQMLRSECYIRGEVCACEQLENWTTYFNSSHFQEVQAPILAQQSGIKHKF